MQCILFNRIIKFPSKHTGSPLPASFHFANAKGQAYRVSYVPICVCFLKFDTVLLSKLNENNVKLHWDKNKFATPKKMCTQ